MPLQCYVSMLLECYNMRKYNISILQIDSAIYAVGKGGGWPRGCDYAIKNCKHIKLCCQLSVETKIKFHEKIKKQKA